MGAEGAYIPLIAAAIGAGGGIGTALMTPSPQERQSFRGTDFDPIKVNSETYRAIMDSLGAATKRAGTPVELPNAVVQDLPTFTGGGMPSPIGVTGRAPDALRRIGIPYTPTGGGPGWPNDHPDTAPGSPITGPTTPPPADTPIPGGPDPRHPLPIDHGPTNPPVDVPTTDYRGASFLGGGGGSTAPTRRPLLAAGGGGNGFGAASGASALPQVSLSPQTRASVQLLLHSLQGMGGGSVGGFA